MHRTNECALIIRILCIGFFAGIAISWPLWLSERDFPAIPVFDQISSPAFPLDYILVGGSLLTLIWLFCKPSGRNIWLFLLPIGVLLITDYMRWQPWVYQYLLMMIVLALYMRSPKSANYSLNSLRLLMICIYLYSGISKINPIFFEYAVDAFFPWLLTLVSENFYPVTRHLAVGIIVVEMVSAAGLFARYRKAAAVILMLMHAGILIFIVAMNRWNPVIIPWNLVMISLLYVLFIRNRDFAIRDVLWNRGTYTHAVLWIIVGLMPALSYLNMWDKYLSFHLYSFSTENVHIVFYDDAVISEEVVSASYVIKTDSMHVLNLSYWSMKAMKVPVYPEPRVYRKIVRTLCDEARETVKEIHHGPVYFERELGRSTDCEGF